MAFRNAAGRVASLLEALDDRRDIALSMAVILSQQSDVEAAFAAWKHPELTRLTLPTWIALDNRFDLAQCQLHVPPATSFLRLHDLDACGDDLSSFRRSVVDAISGRQPVAGLEIGGAISSRFPGIPGKRRWL